MMKNTGKVIWFGAAVAMIAGGLLSLCGCGGPDAAVRKNGFFDEWRTRAEQSRGFSPPAPAAPPAPVSEPLGAGDPPVETPPTVAHAPNLASGAGDAGVPQLPSRKISLQVKDVDVATLLRALARAASQNILITQNVVGTATISVRDMPWDVVFEGILKAHGLAWRREGDLLRIMALKDLEQEIQVMEALQKKAAREKEFYLQMDSLRTRAEMVEPLKTWVYHVKYADTVTLRDNLENFLRTARVGTDWSVSDKDQGKTAGTVRGAILVDPHTNSLIVQAVQSDIDRIREAVALLDIPTRQVLIEAYIVQATDSAARELGVQWGGGYKTIDGSGSHYLTSGANSTGGLGSALDTAAAPTTGSIVNFPAAGVDATTGFTLGYLTQNLGQHLLSVQLSALESDGKLEILSSPSITTLDNRKAIIESGKEIPFQTTDDGNVNIEYKKAVLSLEVTPYVVDEGTLKLSIATKKDEPDFATTVDGQPTIITRKAETNVVLLDGQTTVIGGLSEKKRTRNEDGVPAVKDLPLLGHLFKSNAKEDNLDELLIFITPHILKEAPVSRPEQPGQTGQP